MREQITYAFINLKGASQFGEAVRRFRKLRGLTQQQLADLTGCSIMYVSQLERGKETAELGKALKILDVLDVDISFSNRGDGA
ncbi:MAG: helix-turn-helix domain-containing protein [Coriobacteriales bacterium]|jgi:HTH-type transcriptional regulator/antitoxin HipB